MASFGVLGTKYYTSSPDGKFTIIRVTKSKKNGQLTVKDEENNNVFKTTLEELKEKGYRRLKPNGMMCFAVVRVGVDEVNKYATDDVVVSLFRQSDLDTNNGIPYAVCRQNINDIFYQYMSADATDSLVGLSCTQDSFPEMEKIDFSAMLRCDEVYEDQITNVYVYLQDTLDIILSMVKVSIYDKVLSGLRNSYIKLAKEMAATLNQPVPAIIQFDPLSKPPLMGYCNTLKDLLESNNFPYDFDSTFNIVPINMQLLYNESTGELHPDQIRVLQEITHRTIGRTCVVKYGHDVNLNEINLNYQLIRDITGDVFVVGYTELGEYVESDPEVVKIKNNMMEYLAYSRTKYSQIPL